MTRFFVKDVKPGDAFLYTTCVSNLRVVHTVLAVEDVSVGQRKITTLYSYKDCTPIIRIETLQRDCLYTITDACITVLK